MSGILGLPLLDAIDVATHCARYKNEESEPGDRAGKFARARGRNRVATCDLSLAAGVRRHARGRLEMQIEREDGYDTYDYDTNRRAPGRIPHVARNEGVNNGEHDRAIEGRFRGADADLSFGAHTAFGTNTANGA